MGETYKERCLSAPKPDDMPDGIGPHECIELELMLAGTKPAAMFYGAIPGEEEFIPEEEFDPYVANGLFVKKVFLSLSRQDTFPRGSYSVCILRLSQ